MKTYYLTSSIAYTNASPHIGFALELIQADVIARYHRSLGEDVFFLTGTDEHGRKVAEAAEKAGKSPQEFTDKVSSQFRELTETLNISNNDFIRTTDKKRHWPTVKKVWLKLKQKGDIYKLPYKSNSFDLVVCTEVLEHLENPKKALRELIRVSGKYILLSVPNEPFFRLSNFLRGKNLPRWGNDIEHVQNWTSSGFAKFVNIKGVKIIDKKHPFPWTIILLKKVK